MHIPSTICLLEDSFSEHKARQGLSDIRAVAEMGDVALGSSSCLDSRNRFRCLLLKETGMGSTRGQSAQRTRHPIILGTLCRLVQIVSKHNVRRHGGGVLRAAASNFAVMTWTYGTRTVMALILSVRHFQALISQRGTGMHILLVPSAPTPSLIYRHCYLSAYSEATSCGRRFDCRGSKRE